MQHSVIRKGWTGTAWGLFQLPSPETGCSSVLWPCMSCCRGDCLLGPSAAVHVEYTQTGIYHPQEAFPNRGGWLHNESWVSFVSCCPSASNKPAHEASWDKHSVLLDSDKLVNSTQKQSELASQVLLRYSSGTPFNILWLDKDHDPVQASFGGLSFYWWFWHNPENHNFKSI